MPIAKVTAAALTPMMKVLGSDLHHRYHFSISLAPKKAVLIEAG